jgi:hypothetical protein
MKTKSTTRLGSRALQFESLERREVMAAGITAALHAGGVLTVTGTSGDDQIAFHQSGKLISINDVIGFWSASKVKSIIVDLGGGDDLVSLDSLANGGTQKLHEKVTVIAGAGNDRARLSSGEVVHFNQDGQQLYEAPGTAPKLNGATLNMSSSVIASLQSGVLTVTGTNDGDQLLFKQSSSKISISGVSGSWAATKVQSIVVNLQDGTDRVSLDSLANGGAQPLKVAFTITSGAGDKAVHLANGHDVTFSGAGHTLAVAVDGTATLDGEVLTWEPPSNPPPAPSREWFDANIIDAALRSLGDSLFDDLLISRRDMMALFDIVNTDGMVNATEFNDLKTIADNSKLFGSLDDVWKLTTYVVTGNTANANFHGQALGNLAAGSSATQLNNLVNKWFLGLDRPTSSYGYALASGTLFVDGVSYVDIDQGVLGDCGFMASLAETALRSPSTITSMFVVNGDGTYAVRFYHGGVAEYVTVDSYLPNGGGVYAGISNGELWSALAEKAYAQIGEMSWFGRQNSYASIQSLYAYTTLGHITGQSTVGITYTSGSSSESTFANAYSAGKLICLITYASPPLSRIVANHAYAVLSYDAAAHTVTLYNPWGANYSLTTLSWSQVQSNFQYFDRTA